LCVEILYTLKSETWFSMALKNILDESGILCFSLPFPEASMKLIATLITCVFTFGAQTGHAIPILSGSGLDPDAATGSFGNAGRIWEYRVLGSEGLDFAFSQSLGLDGLRLSYSLTATSALAAAGASIFLDAEINEAANTWFYERGEAQVASGGSTSWEIDEPGYGTSYIGDIYDNYMNRTFDNSVFNGQPDLVEDVSLGLGFDFGNLGPGDQLAMEILLSETAIGPGWGTVLHQWNDIDGLGGDNLYFAGRYSIQRFTPPDPDPDPGPGVIPEPGTLALLGLGLLVLVLRPRRRAA
jgi:hypothetical protein